MTIEINQFEPLVEDGDWTPAVFEALAACKKEKDATLLFEKGKTYHFKRQFAYQKNVFMSNNDGGMKSIAFPLIGFSGLTVDGGGADFIFHGELSPFVIENSKNITLKNFSVDYAHPFFLQGEILKSEKGYTDIKFDSGLNDCRVIHGDLDFYSSEDDWENGTEKHLLVTEFDRNTGGPTWNNSPYIARFSPAKYGEYVSAMTRWLKAEDLGNKVVRLYGIDQHNVGNYWVCTATKRNNPGVSILESRDVTLEDITLYHCQAMGVVGQTSSQITLERVKTSLKPGRYLTINCDATHFVNCSGDIVLKDCLFTNMLDDGGNFHGTYTTVSRQLNDQTVYVKFNHPQQYGVMLYHPGDRVYLVKGGAMRRYACLTVKEACWHSEMEIRLTFEEPLPEELEPKDIVENFSRMPNVFITGCETGFNRPRGFLISTCGEVVIEDCTFYNMSCGVQMAGEGRYWFESGPVENVTIRRNHFKNSAYTGGFPILANPEAKQTGDLYYHRGIQIEDNLFESHDKRFISLENCKDCVIQGNRYRFNGSMAPLKALGQDGIQLKSCANVTCEPVEEEQ